MLQKYKTEGLRYRELKMNTNLQHINNKTFNAKTQLRYLGWSELFMVHITVKLQFEQKPLSQHIN